MKVRVDILSLCTGDVTASSLRASLLDANGVAVAVADATAPSAEFDGVAAGAYTAQVVRRSDAGDNVGEALSYGFAISADSMSQTFYGAGINITVIPT
ncbi:hypothetical protein AB4Y43_06935 [Paraburkholderia sp. BR10872]|uniref:hypothetical protein n=1 Tax=Paraburkholderia sp. BR10872 TaxID=3236989 RepID=UPI0034D1AC7C